jgi:hypothetical protein
MPVGAPLKLPAHVADRAGKAGLRLGDHDGAHRGRIEFRGLHQAAIWGSSRLFSLSFSLSVLARVFTTRNGSQETHGKGLDAGGGSTPCQAR